MAHATLKADVTEEQVQHDKEILYRALMFSCQDIPAAKYITQQEHTANGLTTWYNFLQDYGGRENLKIKKKAIGEILTRSYNPSYKGGTLQFLDNMESAWIQLESLDSADQFSDEYKILLISEKFANTEYSQMVMFSLEYPECKMLPGFLQKLRGFLKFDDHSNACQAHQHAHYTESDAHTNDPWAQEDCACLMSTQASNYIIPNNLFQSMKELCPELLDQFIKARN